MSNNLFETASSLTRRQQPSFELHRMSANTDVRLLETFVCGEEIAPFGGDTIDKQLNSLIERLKRPDIITFFIIDPAKPTELKGTLQGIYYKGKPRNLTDILEGTNLVYGKPDTVAFFSIKGYGDGGTGQLIDKAVPWIQAEQPEITNFVTISPVYDFRKYLSALQEEPIRDMPIISSYAALRSELVAAVNDTHRWHELLADPESRMDVDRLCAHYALSTYERGGKYFSPCGAAGFHLSRGAYLDGVNPLSCETEFGLRHSGGYTVNYVYSMNPEVIKTNRASYRVGIPARSWQMQGMISNLPAPAGLSLDHV